MEKSAREHNVDKLTTMKSSKTFLVWKVANFVGIGLLSVRHWHIRGSIDSTRGCGTTSCDLLTHGKFTLDLDPVDRGCSTVGGLGPRRGYLLVGWVRRGSPARVAQGACPVPRGTQVLYPDAVDLAEGYGVSHKCFSFFCVARAITLCSVEEYNVSNIILSLTISRSSFEYDEKEMVEECERGSKRETFGYERTRRVHPTKEVTKEEDDEEDYEAEDSDEEDEESSSNGRN
ncbi:hypothetical protein M9H77_31483 [Catharanthus roseus]|uniref:Uncharacterized protein n=1 Tax=Catharanthus roseus TaxID=4058 RepID=A0ACC0A0L2_CATRO|nr:hypothetical protein M9H77_31483 [Catharanthus roseus]